MDVRRTEGEALATVICRELYYMVEQGWVSPQDAENVLKYTNGRGEKLIAEGKTGVWAGEGMLGKYPADVDTYI